ncbi:MAG: radical SAM protein [Candidatus Hodarchaeaceae archaeon]|nr:radical SAM protein [Candidatus Hodarchaeaceae archaeon]
MNIKYLPITCRTALSQSRLPGLRYSLNPYLGCEHGCIYCYSRSIFRDRQLALNWGKFVKAKQNIQEVLTQELKRKPKGTIGLSTVTDPYQPLESKLQLTRKCLEILSAHDFPVSIQTKSNLVLRDVDLIEPGKFDVGVTITTMDEDLTSKIEPRSPRPDARTQVLEEFASRGVETWLFLGPIIPEVNDCKESLEQVVEVAKKTGSKLMYDKLNLRRWVLESIAPFIEGERPGLVEQLPALLNLKSGWWLEISSMVKTLCAGQSVRCEPAFPT